MRKKILALAMLILTLLAAIGLASTAKVVQAQGDKPIVCDSTLITLEYLAEHDYGFHSAMDLTKFDTGQFRSWFDELMAAGGSMMQSTQEAMMAGTQEAMMGGTMEAGMAMTELKPGVVQGEDASCTKLRAEVEDYLFKTISGKMTKK